MTVTNPEDDSIVIGSVQVASEQDVDKAVAAAKAAYPEWRKTPSAPRSAIILKYADLVDKYVDDIAKLESVAMGQPVSITKVIISVGNAAFRYYAGQTDKMHGEIDAQRTAMV